MKVKILPTEGGDLKYTPMEFISDEASLQNEMLAVIHKHTKIPPDLPIDSLTIEMPARRETKITLITQAYT